MTDAEELQRLRDREAIRDLTARYNHTFDNRDGAGHIACWTEDGYVERLNSQPRAQGHAALAALAENFRVNGRHVCTDNVITLDGDTAAQETYLIYLDMTPPCEMSMFGCYHDTLVRTAEGWKFKQRIFEPYFIRDTEKSM